MWNVLGAPTARRRVRLLIVMWSAFFPVFALATAQHVTPIHLTYDEVLRTTNAVLRRCTECHQNSPAPSVQALRDSKSVRGVLLTMSQDLLNEMLRRTRVTAFEDAALREYVRYEKARTDAELSGPRGRLIGSAFLTASHAGVVTPKRHPNPELHLRTPPPAPEAKRASACHLSSLARDAALANFPNILTGSSYLAARLSKAITDDAFLFYDRTFVPRTWQRAAQEATPAIPRFNIPAGEALPPVLLSASHPVNGFMMRLLGYHSDGAREFPWLHTAGLDASPNATAMKFAVPPTRQALLKILLRDRETDPEHFGESGNLNGPQLGWRYDSGALFGEVLLVTHPETGEQFPFEVRLRFKTTTGNWDMDVLRPFANALELAAGIRNLCARSALKGCRILKHLTTLQDLEQPATHPTSREEFINADAFGTKRDPLTLSRTALTAVEETALIHDLPVVPADVVGALLKETPFKSVFNKPWVREGGNTGWAPTTQAGFHIVPKNYFAAFVPLTRASCLKCHDSAGRHVDNFDPVIGHPRQIFEPYEKDVQSRPRTWYNHIPGDDGILSFHPFSAAAVARKAHADEDALHGCLVRAGLIHGLR